MDSRKTQRAAESEDWIGWHATALRLGAATDPEAREMQRRLLRDDDLAVIEAMAESLVRSQDVGSVALVCEASVTESDQIGDTLNMVLLPLWKSGAADVPRLLVAVTATHDGAAKEGARAALRWLGVQP